MSLICAFWLVISNMVSISSYNSHAKEGFSESSVGKESACNADSIPGVGRSAGEGKGYTLQYSGLESSMDCTVHGVAKSWTWVSDFYFFFMQKNSVITFKSSWMKMFRNHCAVLRLVTQSCLTPCDPMDCSPPGSSLHGILQARVLEWAAISFPMGITSLYQ